MVYEVTTIFQAHDLTTLLYGMAGPGQAGPGPIFSSNTKHHVIYRLYLSPGETALPAPLTSLHACRSLLCASLLHCHSAGSAGSEPEVYAGQEGLPGNWSDGHRLEARFNMPEGLCGDQEGNVFVADRGNFVVRRVDAKTGLLGSG